MKISKKLIGLLLMFTCAFSGTALSYNGALEDVTLSVTVERKVSPDMAYVNYSVTGQGQTSKIAAEQAAIKAVSVKKTLLKNAITSEMLEQVSYRVNPVYNDKQKIIGYKAINSLKVRVEELDKLGDIVDSLTSGGADNVGNITYTLKNRDTYQNLLLADAVKMAQKKASVIANAGGRSLGRLLTARVNSYTTMPRMANTMLLKAADSAEPITTVIESKDIELHADVEAAFALE